jgi:hypothetical protein
MSPTPHGRHRWRRYAAFGLLVAVASLLPLASLASASSPNDPNSGHQVTLCHNENNLHSITVDVAAGGLQGGHEGHSGDIIPSFSYYEKVGNDYNTTPTVYGGKNLGTMYGDATGAQVLAHDCQLPTSCPPGTHHQGGDPYAACVPDIVDLCTNLEGVQNPIPAGYEDPDNDKVCTQPPVDVCTNIEGLQTSIPAGLEDPDNDKVCTPPDLCTNLDGIQSSIPAGYEDPNNDKVCTQVVIAGIDLCTNLEGAQLAIPAGYEDPDGDHVCTQVATAGVTSPPTGSEATPTETTTETPTATASETATPTATETAVPAGETLPFTGLDLRHVAWGGVLLMLSGLGLWTASLRRDRRRLAESAKEDA